MVTSVRNGHFSSEDIATLIAAGLEIETFQPDRVAEQPRKYSAPSTSEEEIEIEVEVS